MKTDYHKSERLIPLPAVLDRVGYKRSRLLDLERQGVFPKPVKLGTRAVAGPESDVDDPLERPSTGKGA